MALIELMDLQGTEVSLIPGSGVQFLDFGFSVRKDSPVPRDWGIHDPKTTFNNGQPPQLVRRGDDAVHGSGKENYTFDMRAIEDTFADVWMPIPLFRVEKAGGYWRGPLNWARVHLTKLANPDPAGNQFRLVLALDTALLDYIESEAYLAPSQLDARDGYRFSLPAHDEPIDWFYRQGWINDWCMEVFKEMVKRNERRRRPNQDVRAPTNDELHQDHMEGSNEHLARYKAYMDLLKSLSFLPTFFFVDLTSRPRPKPIDVDMVLDLGNSRTCGLLIEEDPDQHGVDISTAVRLRLRDLSDPAHTYDDAFPSRFEFARARFGHDHLSERSLRSEAFSWPTMVRVGDEAARLAGRRRSTEGASGMSSPKRYLWDGDERQDPWRFSNEDNLAMNVFFSTLVDDRGNALHLDNKRFPAARAVYSRQNLTSFALAEIFVQALTMMNSPTHRLRRPFNAKQPRRLRRIILTKPTAMPLAERHVLKQQAEVARDLAYLSMRLARVDYTAEGMPKIVYGEDALPGTEQPECRPEVKMDWDEATATQVVYLYTQVAVNYSGDARAFFDNMRHPINALDPATRDSFRLATIDIGGGTTDLVVTSFKTEGKGANVTIIPEQKFREGFNVAGDDLLFRIVSDHVVASIREYLRKTGLGDKADFVLTQLIGVSEGGHLPEKRMRRQQFATQIAAPIALRMLHQYENFNEFEEVQVESRLFADFFSTATMPSEDLIAYFNREIKKFGVDGIDLRNCPFVIDPREIDVTVGKVFKEMLRALGEAVWRLRCDILILSGRPSRLPAVVSLLRESCALPPHRVVPLHLFRVGSWYPFPDHRGTVSDPKTTAAVGAMVCLLGNGQLNNFNFRSSDLESRSTARFFGKLGSNGKLGKDDEFFNDLNLDDNDYLLPEKPFEFHGPMPLGFRQMAADWWPGTLLYSIKYMNTDVAAKLNVRTPLRVSLKRDRKMTREGILDSFEIRSIVDREDRSIPNPTESLRMRLQTMDNLDGYWLDTGVLFDLR